MLRMVEIKPTRRIFTVGFGRVYTTENIALIVRVQMPRIETVMNGKLYIKYLNPDELGQLFTDKLENWKELVRLYLVDRIRAQK